MPAIIRYEATVTSRGQTTIPAPMRRMLGVERSGTVVFQGMEDGSVLVTPKAEPHEDPAFAGFLQLIERDIAAHPEHLAPVTDALRMRVGALTEGVTVDMDAPLGGDDD